MLTCYRVGLRARVGQYLRPVPQRGPHTAASSCRPVNRRRATEATATFPEAVREKKEVVPVNAVTPWVLSSGATVGR
ncbi:hypothetical protein C0Q60_14420 [Streptomyces albidoflavus]|nr:hypothetical protein C0Q60_14420 [Streptomyces albidoflavus]RZD98425.1 hypothetical protein C0Q62_14300 [Streptomyces albidoflavus]